VMRSPMPLGRRMISCSMSESFTGRSGLDDEDVPRGSSCVAQWIHVGELAQIAGRARRPSAGRSPGRGGAGAPRHQLESALGNQLHGRPYRAAHRLPSGTGEGLFRADRSEGRDRLALATTDRGDRDERTTCPGTDRGPLATVERMIARSPTWCPPGGVGDLRASRWCSRPRITPAERHVGFQVHLGSM